MTIREHHGDKHNHRRRWKRRELRGLAIFDHHDPWSHLRHAAELPSQSSRCVVDVYTPRQQNLFPAAKTAPLLDGNESCSVTQSRSTSLLSVPFNGSGSVGLLQADPAEQDRRNNYIQSCEVETHRKPTVAYLRLDACAPRNRWRIHRHLCDVFHSSDECTLRPSLALEFRPLPPTSSSYRPLARHTTPWQPLKTSPVFIRQGPIRSDIMVCVLRYNLPEDRKRRFSRYRSLESVPVPEDLLADEATDTTSQRALLKDYLDPRAEKRVLFLVSGVLLLPP
ncbi:hypothetical protein ACJZ2D_009916 [Fusarium nematophilum]